jgi:hypothetical protein
MNTETITKKTKARISVTDAITRTLISEFKVSGNTVRVSLKFYSDSETSKKIRSRANELMQETVKLNALSIQEYDQD